MANIATCPAEAPKRVGGLAAVESALRARKLDRTLTTALAPLERIDPSALVPMDVSALDACLRGGLPRGQLSELAGPRSSGRLTLLLQMMAAATARGEIVALVDTLDRFDVASAAAAGVDLSRLLWIRGQDIAPTDRALDRALKALNLVLQAGGFGVVAKSIGSSNPYNMVRATFDALKHQDSPRSVAARRNIKVSTLQSRRVGGDAEVVAE